MTQFEIALCEKPKNPDQECERIIDYCTLVIPGNYNPDTDGTALDYLRDHLTVDQIKAIHTEVTDNAGGYTENYTILVSIQSEQKFTLTGLNNALDEATHKATKSALFKYLQKARQDFYLETQEFITPELAQDICDFFNEKDGLNLTTK